MQSLVMRIVASSSENRNDVCATEVAFAVTRKCRNIVINKYVFSFYSKGAEREREREDQKIRRKCTHVRCINLSQSI